MNNPLGRIFKNSVLKGTFILTIAGLAGKCMGFYYKIFLSNTIGADGIGLYQLVFPIMGIAMSICSVGIETAISRFCAQGRNRHGIFTTGLILSLILSAVTTFIIYTNSNFIAQRLLLNIQTAPLVRIMSLSVPFACIHQCINGYYYGLKRTKIPAISQILEQFVRVGSVLAITCFLTNNSQPVTPVIAIYGIVCGEIAASIFSVIAMQLNLHFRPDFTKFGINIRKVISMSFPLSCNRILLTLLQSGEAILIPAQLIIYGMSKHEALTVYGVLTGMALSFITFPSTITQSAALMLLPTVSQAQSSNNTHTISASISTSVMLSLMMGIYCIGGFIAYGAPLGAILFGNPLVAAFIRSMSWLCPFLYLNTTLAGILNGLGKTSTTFLCNVTGVIIRLIFVMFFIPRYGVNGWMWGLLASHIFIGAAYITKLRMMYNYRFDAIRCLVLPIAVLVVSIAISLTVYGPMLRHGIPQSICLSSGLISSGIIYCLLLYLFCSHAD